MPMFHSSLDDYLDDQDVQEVLDTQLETPETGNVAFTTDHRDLRGGRFWESIPAYANVSEDLFNDPTWQMKNSVRDPKDLVDLLRDTIDEDFIQDVEAGFARAPMAVRITPYVLGLIDWENPHEDPLRRQFIPLGSQMTPDHPELHLDTLNEQDDSPVLGLTHRYPDRALFLALDICPVYCRYCTRSYAVGFDTNKVEKMKLTQSEARWKEVFEYLDGHPMIEDVVVSGGDAYMLRANRIRLIGETLLNMPNIRRVRFATKGPAIFPQKVLGDKAWYEALRYVVRLGRKKHKEVCLHTHFSHPNEITEITKRMTDKFIEDGITVRNQAVYQCGVNDDPETMILLTKRLAYVNVQPYYVYMHDLVKGVEDLRTTLQSGIDTERRLRGATAGFNTPLFVVDAPGGGGKRDIHSYETYDRETGISVYTAPTVKPGQYFLYYDPIDTLSLDIQRAWRDGEIREEMKRAALRKARHGR